MLADVTPAAGQRVVAQTARQCSGETAYGARQTALRFEDAAIAEHQSRQGDQIRRRPVAVHERLAEPDVPAGQRAEEEAIVPDDQRRIELAAVAERIDLSGALEPQRPAADAFEAGEERRPGPGRDHCTCSMSVRVLIAASGAARSPTPSAAARGTIGAPFHHSRSACQWMPATTVAVIAG